MFEKIRNWWDITEKEQLTRVRFPNKSKTSRISLMIAVILGISLILMAVFAPRTKSDPLNPFGFVAEPFLTISTVFILLFIFFLFSALFIGDLSYYYECREESQKED